MNKNRCLLDLSKVSKEHKVEVRVVEGAVTIGVSL